MTASGEVVRWGSGPVAFELESPDTDVVEAAKRVFGKWRPLPNAPVKGRWRAERASDEFVVTPRRPPEPGSELQTIRDPGHAVAVVEYAAIYQIVESCDDLLCFHAALLSKNGKGVAIVGQSHAGKSTLATGLWQNGWRFHCDDLTIVADGKAFAGPRRVALRTESRAHLGDDLWSRVPETKGYFKTSVGCLFQPMHLDDTEPASVELSGVFFLKRNGASQDVSSQQLVPAHAALALLPYTNLVRTRPFPDALAPVASLMTNVPGWDLARRPLPEMIATVERLAGDT